MKFVDICLICGYYFRLNCFKQAHDTSGPPFLLSEYRSPARYLWTTVPAEWVQKSSTLPLDHRSRWVGTEVQHDTSGPPFLLSGYSSPARYLWTTVPAEWVQKSSTLPLDHRSRWVGTEVQHVTSGPPFLLLSIYGIVLRHLEWLH